MASKTERKEIPEQPQYFTPIQHNLLKTLEKTGPSTRKDLVKHLNTARTTIFDNLVKLQKKKRIEKFSRNKGNRGRPYVYWRIKEV